MEKINTKEQLSNPMRTDMVAELQKMISTDLFPVMIYDQSEVEFEEDKARGLVKVYVRGEYVQHLRKEQWERFTVQKPDHLFI